MAVSLGGATLSLNTLAKTQSMLEKLTERLATGRRVNRGMDDAAGLAIAAGLSAEHRVLGAARNNIGQGQAVLQIADGGLSSQQDLLSRAQELAVQAANGILSDQDRATLNSEFRSLVGEVDRIGSSTAFSELNLLGGSTPTDINVKVGSGSDSASSIGISINPSTADSLGGTDPGSGTTLTLNDLDISTAEGANTAMAILGSAFEQVGANRAAIGASSNRLEVADRVAATSMVNTEDARSRLVDLDVGRAVSAFKNAESLAGLGAKTLKLQNQQRGAILDLLI